MQPSYWHKQTSQTALFPELEWSRPENKQFAGKLLIIGGNAYGFSATATAYNEAGRAGVGSRRVLLPDALKKTVGPIIQDGEYAPSTPSGSFAQKALVDALQLAAWADGILLAGDLGRNAETAILLEKLLDKSSIWAVITKDAADYVSTAPQTALRRPKTALVISFSQLQRLSISVRFEFPLTFDMGLVKLVDWLHLFTERYDILLVIKYLADIIVAYGGQISSTRLEKDVDIWRVKTASQVATWLIQNSTKPFEAATSAVRSII